MRAILFLFCIITFSASSQDCRIPVIDYAPNEIIGNYFLYQFMPKKSGDSILLITGTYDSIQMIQTNVQHVKVHSMAGTYRDPGVSKIHFDVYRNILCRKTYGETYDGKYKYIALHERTYNDEGYLVSQSNYGTSNVPSSFVYADSLFEQAIKQNYTHRAAADCISRYQYKDGHVVLIENFMNGSLVYANELSYTSGNLTMTKVYNPDGTKYAVVEFVYSSKGFTQTLYYVHEQDGQLKKEPDSYFWKYKKEQGRITELSYGKNGEVIDRNEYGYNTRGRLTMVKLYDAKSLKYIQKYYYK